MILDTPQERGSDQEYLKGTDTHLPASLVLERGPDAPAQAGVNLLLAGLWAHPGRPGWGAAGRRRAHAGGLEEQLSTKRYREISVF